ncbi:hypothetical protein [Streptomyces longispororuber]|uniref:hypothetical protein n=1 Tax=Streptomyces longispororuber TaxID=68230 RepID=UPI0036FEA5B4
MITAMQRAEAMALQVFIAARRHNGRVVTHDLVDAVMSRDADKEQGKANKETVRRIIRRQAEAEFVRVIFTDEERYWAIREQLHHMDTGQVQAMRDEIADAGYDDPRVWDRVLVEAISVRLSNRVPPRRLWRCRPVSIRLWDEPAQELPEVRTTRGERLAEITGPLDASLAEAFADMYGAVANGTAVPVPVGKARAGMVVVAAVRLEDRTIGTVRQHTGPGQPWVSLTWTCRSHQDSVIGDRRVFAPEDYVMVTVESLESLGMLASRRDHVRAGKFAGKWVAESEHRHASGLSSEPTDEALQAAFQGCVKPPKPELYPLIRAEIAAWDDNGARPPAERQ